MFIIAEIGLEHCGSEARAKQLLDRLLATNIDAVTFQIREKEFYDGSHPRKTELPDDFYRAALWSAHVQEKQLGFAIAQPKKIDFLSQHGASFWKTLSWDLSNNALQTALQKTGKKIYVSTGVSGIEEIEAFNRQYQNIEFIHTTLTDALEDVNLKAIAAIRQAAGKPVAFGLHSRDPKVMFAALGFEPSAFFFYVKDDTDGEHPDGPYALSINEAEKMVNDLKVLAKAIGDGKKVSKTNTLHPADDEICKSR